MTSVALGDIHLRFAWQVWHLATSVLRGRRGTYMALGWLWCPAWARLVAGDAAQLCVAGKALGDIHFRFAWQAWHLVTSTFVLHGRGRTFGTGLALVARLGALGRAWSPVTLPNFAWQVWRLATSTFVSSVALGDIQLRFPWQA